MKQQILQGLPEEELTVFEISINEIASFLKHFLFFDEKEFRYNGKMYDVVRIENHNDVILYYAIHDDKESDLFLNLDSSVKNTMENSPDRQNQVRNFTFLLSLVYISETNLLVPQSLNLSEVGSGYFFSVQSWIEEPSSPPPMV